MKYFKLLLPGAVIAAFITGCEKTENVNPPEDKGYSKGVYIINEGSYGANNGSISFFDPEQHIITNGIFEAANNRPLGDIVQSFSLVRDTIGCIVVNNSSKVEMVSLKTFKTIADPLPVFYPRYFMQVSDNKGYLTGGNYQGYVYVINLNVNMIEDSIKVGFGPETMLLSDNVAWVANSGGWGSDSTISVINTTTDNVIDTVLVGKVPIDMVFDADKNIWVYSKGYTDYADIETDAVIQKINPDTRNIIWQAKVGTALEYSATPPKCAGSRDGSSIFYLRPDGVYMLDASDPEIQNDPIVSGSFYGLEVNPSDGNIYVFESSFSGNGTMKVFDETGDPVGTGTVGIGPSGAVFNLENK